MAENVVNLTRSSASSYGSAIQVMWAAKDLMEPAEMLGREVDGFLTTVRAS
ncbi:MAG: hypothetical protein H7840_01825 [Alphaproteobacteria bacterium]